MPTFARVAPRRTFSLGDLTAFSQDRVGFFAELARQERDVFPFQILWQELVIFNHPDLIRRLLIEQPGQQTRDTATARMFRRFLGQGVLLAEGAAWARQRKLLVPAFHAQRLAQYVSTMATFAGELGNEWATQKTVTVDVAMTRLTLRIIAKTMFDVDVTATVDALQGDMQQILAVGEAQLDAPVLLPAWVPTRQNVRQRRALRGVNRFLYDLIRERRREGTDHGDVLSLLLHAKDDEQQGMTDEQIRDECMTLLVAGHETTAAALTWTWYLLAQHPEVVARLEQELGDVLGGRLPTSADLPRLRYTEAVVKEAMRLYPPVAAVARVPHREVAFGKLRIKPGTLVMVSPYVTHHDARYFPDPECFNPDRFLGEAPAKNTYLPFSTGPRVCLGSVFAMLEAKVILATLAQRVRLQHPRGMVVPTTRITLRPRDPLIMQAVTPLTAASLA